MLKILLTNQPVSTIIMFVVISGPSGGMADAADSKSAVREYVGVRVPSRALKLRVRFGEVNMPQACCRFTSTSRA